MGIGLFTLQLTLSCNKSIKVSLIFRQFRKCSFKPLPLIKLVWYIFILSAAQTSMVSSEHPPFVIFHWIDSGHKLKAHVHVLFNGCQELHADIFIVHFINTICIVFAAAVIIVIYENRSIQHMPHSFYTPCPAPV